MSAPPPGSASRSGSKPEAVHLAEQRLHARLRVGPAPGLDAPRPAGRGRVGRLGADALGEHGEHARRAGCSSAGRDRGRARPARASRRAGAARRCPGAPARRRRGRPRGAVRGAAGRCWRAGPSRSASSVAVSAVVEPASSWYMEKRVSSPRAFKTASRSISLTVLRNRAYFQGLHWFYSVHDTMPADPTSRPGRSPPASRPRTTSAASSRASSTPSSGPRSSTSGWSTTSGSSPNGDVMVKVALTTAACPLRGQIGTDVRSKVAGLPGRRRGRASSTTR